VRNTSRQDVLSAGYTHTMDLNEIVQAINAEIIRLEQVRALLTDRTASLKRTAPTRKRGTMSAEGRASIAAAQRARWAKVKRAER
jgi:hypothetical protein